MKPTRSFLPKLLDLSMVVNLMVLCLALLLGGCILGANSETPEATPTAEVETTPDATEAPTAEPPTPTPTKILEIKGRITASSLWVRSGPGTNYSLLNGVSFDDEVTLKGRNGDSSWYLCELGWIFAEYVHSDEDVSRLPVLYDPDSDEPSPTPITPTPQGEIEG
jgi:uncharacterized protein YgiM (DUF1202 family)